MEQKIIEIAKGFTDINQINNWINDDTYNLKNLSKYLQYKLIYILIENTEIKIINKTFAKNTYIQSNALSIIKIIETEATAEEKQALFYEKISFDKVYLKYRPKSRHRERNDLLEKIEEETKICTVCKLRKPLSDFSRKSGKIIPRCKICENYVRYAYKPINRKDLRTMDNYIVDGVDTILEDMKSKTNDVLKGKAIKNDILIELETITTKYNNDLNKFLYMGTLLANEKSSKKLLIETIKSLKIIIKLMEGSTNGNEKE